MAVAVSNPMPLFAPDNDAQQFILASYEALQRIAYL